MDLELSFPKIKIEIKTRSFFSYRFADILLETISVLKNNQILKKGWLYTSQADVIIYVWKSEQKHKFQDGYLLFRKQLTDLALAQNWDLKYPIRNVENKGYITRNIAVPINDLIKLNLIDPIKKDYNQILQKWFV